MGGRLRCNILHVLAYMRMGEILKFDDRRSGIIVGCDSLEKNHMMIRKPCNLGTSCAHAEHRNTINSRWLLLDMMLYLLDARINYSFSCLYGITLHHCPPKHPRNTR